MGNFGYKVGQSDVVRDICFNLKDSCFNEVFIKYGTNYVFSKHENLDDDYDIPVILFLTSLVVESCNPGFISKEFYGNPGDSAYNIISISRGFSISDKHIVECKEAIKLVVNHISSNKGNYMEDTLKGYLYDSVGLNSSLNFNNKYEYYKEVLSELLNGLKKAKPHECFFNEYSVSIFKKKFIAYAEKKDINAIPEIDALMLQTGYRDILCLDSEEYNRCYYLAKKVDKFDGDIFNFLLNCLSKKVSNFFEDLNVAFLDGEGYLYYTLGVDCEKPFSVDFTVEEYDKDNIKYGFSSELTSISNKELFWEKVDIDGFSQQFKKCLLVAINEYEEKNITLDKVQFRVEASLATDIDKITDVHLFKGIGRMFEDDWDVPESPEPMTDDTYKAIYCLVIPEDSNTRRIEAIRAYFSTQLANVCDIEPDDERYSIYSNIIDHYNYIDGTGSKYVSDELLLQWEEKRIQGTDLFQEEPLLDWLSSLI